LKSVVLKLNQLTLKPMKLTDKCKTDFEKWYFNFKYHKNGLHKTNVAYFKTLPLSMQYGVYVDFFDSVDIDICIYFGDGGGYEVNIYAKKYYALDRNTTRQEAREQAIEKANEIYNVLNK